MNMQLCYHCPVEKPKDINFKAADIIHPATQYRKEVLICLTTKTMLINGLYFFYTDRDTQEAYPHEGCEEDKSSPLALIDWIFLCR